MCSSSLPAVCLRAGRSLTAYLTLLRLGFAVPLPLPSARWALTPPFHPYLRSSAGGLFSVALSVVHPHAQELPGNPAQWSPDFPRMAAFASRDRPISSSPEIYPELTQRTIGGGSCSRVCGRSGSLDLGFPDCSSLGVKEGTIAAPLPDRCRELRSRSGNLVECCDGSAGSVEHIP